MTASGEVGRFRQKLARKYVRGLTPGFRLEPGLGGNVRGLRATRPSAGARSTSAPAGGRRLRLRRVQLPLREQPAAVVNELLRELAAVV
jgi:hypothetical protein